MSSNLDQKKVSAIEEALKLKDEGKRLSFIIEKFPDYESEIREIFGTVAFIKESKGKISAPKNILKTLLSKISDSAPVQAVPQQRKEIHQEDNIFIPAEEKAEDVDLPLGHDDGSLFSRWKIIIPVIILAIAMGIILLRSDSRMKNEITNENIETLQNSNESDLAPDEINVSSSTDEL